MCCLLRYYNELFRLEICSTCSGAVKAIVKIKKTNTGADSTGIITAPTGRRRQYQSFPPETLLEILMELLTSLNPGGCAAPLVCKAQRVHGELQARSNRGVSSHVGAGQLIVRSIYSLVSFEHMCVSQCVKNHSGSAPPLTASWYKWSACPRRSV